MRDEGELAMLLSTSLPNNAQITKEQTGSKAENPERKLTLLSYKNNLNEGRHRVLLQFGDQHFQFVDSDAYEEAKLLFSLSNKVIPCFWSPKVPSHLPNILCTAVLTKLVELIKEHGNTWSVAHMCVSLPLPEDTMMILLASDAFKGHFRSTHHPKQYGLLHLAIEQKSLNACKAIMRCSERWLEEDPGFNIEDIDHKLPIQKAIDVGAQEIIDYLFQGYSLHDEKMGGYFGFFQASVLPSFQNALETKNYNKTKELLESNPKLIRADFVDGDTGLHKAKDAKVQFLMFVCVNSGGGVWVCVGVCCYDTTIIFCKKCGGSLSLIVIS